MKKFILMGFLLAIVSIVATGCSSCQSEKQKQDAVTVVTNDYDGVVQDFTADISNIQALHRQTVFSLIKGQKYEWRNSKIIFNEAITAQSIDDLHVVDVTDVFYYWNQGPRVQFITSNVLKGTLIPKPIPDVWIEDADLSEAQIKLSAEDALQRLKEWNGVIPKATAMTLRLPLGPRRCNAQWVVGDIGDVIFIDAVTGDITNWCPAFPIPNVNGPLGEWP